MTLYSHFTPSHRGLFEQFLNPSLREHFLCDQRNRLVVSEGEQITTTGCFSDEGFNRTTIGKVRLWLRAAEENLLKGRAPAFMQECCPVFRRGES